MIRQRHIQLTVHDWPEKEGTDLPLIEEYTYMNLRVNVGLSDTEFSPTQLESKAAESTKTVPRPPHLLIRHFSFVSLNKHYPQDK